MPALTSIPMRMEEFFRFVRTPITTGRLQFQPGFGFADAAAVVPYLRALGITDVYSSPFLRARPGSRHGYDICDHSTTNPELGGQAQFDRFVNALAAAELGQVCDIVPNHMCIDPMCNAWWRDVLEHGRTSMFADFFDIDWTPIKPELKHKVLLPILSCQYGEALEAGQLRLEFARDAIVLRVGSRSLPIRPESMADVLAGGISALSTSPEAPEVVELLEVVSALRHLPAGTRGVDERQARRREVDRAKQRLATLAASTWIGDSVQQWLDDVNGRAGEPSSFARLHAVLESQAYRLASWRTSAHEINYRRFFDVDELAGLRMEDPRVFEATHAFFAAAIASGRVTGLRVDHPDGLALPAAYFDRLQQLAAGARHGSAAVPAVIYVVAEKILTPGEAIPADWRVHGTTGYRFLNVVNGLFVNAEHARALSRAYRHFTGRRESFQDTAYWSRKLVMETSLASELNVLAQALNRLSERNWRSRDFTLNSLRRALREFVACLSVYRTYVTPDGRSASDEERILAAVSRARRRNPELEPSIFDFLADVLLDPPPGARPAHYPPLDAADRAERMRFTLKLQQYTGPVHAKGLEDTAFYRYNLLLSLNEVGGDPASPGVPVSTFHVENDERQRQRPLEMLATTTHDAKLGEDVRARLNVLSEIPDRWRRAVARWARTNAPHRTRTTMGWAPDRNDEYRFYQVLLGIWPSDQLATEAVSQRVFDYMLKAVREAKVHTSWINQNEEYDRAVGAFVRGVLAGRTAPSFLESFGTFAREVARAGMVNSLAQCVLKVGSPGVPDVYQGTELWDLHLVDPDNRGLVDYDTRRALLHSLEPLLDEAAEPGAREAGVRALVDAWPDGRIKMFALTASLRLRRAHAPLFLAGSYRPLLSEPHDAGSVVAFAREHDGEAVIVVAPRLTGGATIARGTLPVGDVWAGHHLPLPPDWRTASFSNAFTGAAVSIRDGTDTPFIETAELFRVCPVAILRGRVIRGTRLPT